tara:strand:+ start:333 stop:1241 length:909 start_codon:yes stop_codon:yes gene_type:complete
MADRYPLIANSSANQIQELAAADQLNLTASNLIMGDSSGAANNRIKVGAGGDLAFYHDGTHSYIDNVTNDLYLRTTGSGDDIFINSADNIAIKVHGSNDGINITGGGAVQLYHNNSEKLATTSGGVNVTGAITVNGSALQTGPLVAYKAKEFLRSRYSFSGSSWHEIESNNRITHTPAASGNTIIMHTQVWGRNDSGNYGGYANVTDQGTGSNTAMIGEISGGGAVAKGSILGGSTHNEMIRYTGNNNIWMGFHMWGYHVTSNTNAHTFKLFGRMGSGTRYIGDNQMGQFMQIWEYSGNLMQ